MKPASYVLVAAGMLAGALTTGGSHVRAQVPLQPPLTPAPTLVVLSGGDIGFRVDGVRGNLPVGRFVVRVDGRWVEPELSGGGVKPLATK
jgi:hypothetical protein